jgi:creatinine amidohydrolase
MTGVTELAATPWPRLPTRPTVLLPLGSCEQHGPHLPFVTDTTVAHAVARRVAAAAGPPVVLAPAFGYGASGEHEDFPGTLSLGHRALTAALVELGRSAGRWAGRLLIVNGHGGNHESLAAAVPALRAEGRDAAWIGCAPRAGDAHAGRTETALMLALAPEVVHTRAAAPGAIGDLAVLLPRLRAEGVRAVSGNGVLGDPAGATARDGAADLESMVDTVLAALGAWRPGQDGRLAP